MEANSFEELKAHIGHKIVCVGYASKKQQVVNKLSTKEDYENISIECDDCFEVLMDFDKPKNEQNKSDTHRVTEV